MAASLSLRSIRFGASGLCLLTLALLSGCTRESTYWAGTWEGERKGLTIPEKEDVLAQELREVIITISPEGTFKKKETSVTSSGKAKFGPEKAFLTETHRLDRPIEEDKNMARQSRELILEKVDENTILYWDPGALTPGSVEMKRATGPAVQKD
jgi:hypothetical protein